MSQRFLKYETEVENPLVDENGVIKSTASEMTIVDLSNVANTGGKIENDNTTGDILKELVRSGKRICFYYKDFYMYPFSVSIDLGVATYNDFTDEPRIRFDCQYVKFREDEEHIDLLNAPITFKLTSLD